MTRSAPARPQRPLRLLIVDDSAMFRRMLALGLAHDPRFEILEAVGSAAQARRVMMQTRPDVIALDLEMPHEDGLSLLRDYMAKSPVPTVVISAHTASGISISLTALEAGAVDVIAKPRLGLPAHQGVMHPLIADIAQRLADAAEARFGAMSQAAARIRAAEAAKSREGTIHPPAARANAFRSGWMIALGSSTGGVQALTAILPDFPPDCPPILIVQHMPEGFTAAFARRLDALCQIDVREARAGDRPRAGLALLAPGGAHHMVLERRSYGPEVALVEGDPVCFSRPSVDVMMQSVAKVQGGHVSAAILTGMGRDGAEGLLALRKKGARCFAQDEESCEIYGMPARAVERGAVEFCVPLDQMASRLIESASQSRSPFGDLSSLYDPELPAGTR